MYIVFKQDKEIGTGTLTECIEFIAATIGQFNPEQVTVRQAVETGYLIRRE